jgi:hypothetical protein
MLISAGDVEVLVAQLRALLVQGRRVSVARRLPMLVEVSNVSTKAGDSACDGALMTQVVGGQIAAPPDPRMTIHLQGYLTCADGQGLSKGVNSHPCDAHILAVSRHE